MPHALDPIAQIVELSSPWRRAVLELLLSNLSPESRAHQVDRLIQDNERILGLIGAVQGDQLLGAAWAQMQPGRTATIWPPCVVRANDALGRQLAVAAVEAAFSAGAKVAQAVISPLDVAEARWFEAAGLRHVADMECLVWQAPSGNVAPLYKNQNDALQWENYTHPTDRLRLEALLCQTWVGSLDCPALDGVRDPSDVLEGYLAAGISQAKHWSILSCRGEDAGCLLLADHADSDELELVYMGLVPHERGHRHGHALVQRAQQMTRNTGRSRLTTAVDASNAPARAVYAAAGFICYDRRRVLLRSCA